MKGLLKRIKVSRVVFMSGILTFMYCIEFFIGIRTVYYTFRAWNNSSSESQEKPVSWTLCVACLFAAVISTFSVNLLSAMWEQKQLDEREQEKSAIRFAFHIVVGGMIWRYINLWCIETKEYQKKGALLLTMIKFLFTQTFTIPMVIVHVSVMDHLEEIIYDAFSIACISTSLIFTCTMFSWCSNEIEELKKWDFETVDLVPLIFQSDVTTSAPSSNKTTSVATNKESEANVEQKSGCNTKDLELILVKIIVFFQTYGFSFGRLLALGILLKLAGIYAVSIMFLQLLISVIYLKFQTPILVSDSLPKWRQLSRLAFMSYILIFEWHLNRDPKTGYDFSSNIKHTMLYYSVATIESVFYLVTWTITTNYTSKYEVAGVKITPARFSRIILIIGSMALVFSLTIHLFLLLWRSRRISVFIYSVKRRYETAKLRLSIYKCGRNTEEKSVKRIDRAHIDISSPIPIKKNEDQGTCHEKVAELEKHNSYRDLREPIDEEIDLYFRKCDTHVKQKDSEDQIESRHITMPDESKEIATGRSFVETLDKHLHNEVNKVQNSASEGLGKFNEPATVVRTETDALADLKNEKNVTGKSPKTSLKSKFNYLSGSISEQWGKVSSVPSKFAGSVRGQIERTKKQFQNIRSNSSVAANKPETKIEASGSSSAAANMNSESESVKQNNDGSEGYFVGDDRCYKEEALQSVKSVGHQHVTFSSEIISKLEDSESDEDTLPASDSNHTVGDSPCLCYICRTLGDSRFRRRRSSSVPPADRKPRLAEDDSIENNNLSRYRSNPNIAQSRCEKKKTEQISNDRQVNASPAKISKATFSLSRLSLENRLQHYV